MHQALAHARAGAGALAAILDAVATPPQRIRMSAALASKAAQYQKTGAGLAIVARLRLASEIRALVAELGGAAQAGPSLAGLGAIASGKHDALSASDLLDKLHGELVDGWGANYDKALSDDAAAAAHAAINRWTKVEKTEYA